MDLDRDRIADIAQRHGVGEREALILYHLGHAFEVYFEIAKEEDYGYDVNLQAWVDHHTGLVNLLMRRVVRRDHPGGWRTGEEIIALSSLSRGQEREETGGGGRGEELAVLLHRLWVTGETYEALYNTHRRAKHEEGAA